MKAKRRWIEKLAYWLPAHQDRYFLGIREAVWATTYKPRFQPDTPESEDPAAHAARANAEMNAFKSRASGAIAAYQQRKSTGRA